MIDVFRIVKKVYSATCFSGFGSNLSGGRWNSRGTAIVYTSTSISLAVLEIIVHWQPLTIIPEFVICKGVVPKKLIENSNIDLKDSSYNILKTQSIGDAWIKSNSSLALRVPSVIIPEESNILINPAHEDYKNFKFIEATDFKLDERLYRR